MRRDRRRGAIGRCWVHAARTSAYAPGVAPPSTNVDAWTGYVHRVERHSRSHPGRRHCRIGLRLRSIPERLWHVQAVVSMITSASGAELDASFARDDAGAERIFHALRRTPSKPIGGALPPKAVERRHNVVLGRTYAPIPPSMLRLEERCLR